MGYSSFITWQSEKKPLLNVVQITIVLYVISILNPGKCSGIDKIDFPALLQIHKKQYDSVKTGYLSILYSEYEYFSDEELQSRTQQRRTDVERSIEQIRQDPNFTSQQKERFISQLEKGLREGPLQIPQVNERKKELSREFTLDISAQKYKLVEKSLDPNDAGTIHPGITLTSERNQIRYRTDIDQAIVDHYDNDIMLNVPAYLGIIKPIEFREIPKEAAVSENTLDGSDVLAYEITSSVQGYKSRIYVDPAIEYRYRKIDIFRNDVVVEEITAKDYKRFGNMLFPTYYEESIYNIDKKHSLRKKTIIQVKDARFNIALDPNALKIKFTPNTTITDLKIGRVYKPFSEKDIEYGVDDLIGKIFNIYVEKNVETSVPKQNNKNDNIVNMPVLTGKPLPELKIFGFESPHADANDKKILVCFFDIEQRPSRNYILELNKKSQEFKAKDVEVILIHASKIEKEYLDKWLKEYNVDFPIGMIEKDEEQTRFNWSLKALPWLILTDRQHIVRAEGFSLDELNDELN